MGRRAFLTMGAVPHGIGFGRALEGYLTHQKQRALGPYSRTMPMVLRWTWGGGLFLMGEVTLY